MTQLIDVTIATHQSYPQMYPSTRQEPMHKTPLGWHHVRVLLGFLLVQLCRRQWGTGVLPWWFAIQTCAMRRGGELRGLC